MAAVASSCSGESSSIVPQAHRAPSGHTAAATFTITWTSATATAAVRRRDTISPSAQSVTITVNGTILAVANRTTSPTQTIPITAPVGQDLFTFNVYDLPSATGHLLGTATVTQQIVDGAANAVTAVIQAVCATTNISVVPSAGALYYATNAPPSGIETVLQKLVVVGQVPVEIAIEPQDVDGNVIISASTGGTSPFTITGSASVGTIDGSHLTLAPDSGSRSTTPDTLTVAASGCPSASVGIEHSPAIYAESTSYYTRILDWYGDVIGGGQLASGDVVIGYDTQTSKMMTYNKSSGQVNGYTLDLSSSSPRFVAPANMLAAWSNYVHGLVGAVLSGASANYYKYVNGQQTLVGASSGYATVALTSSTFSSSPYAFVSLTNGAIGEISLSSDMVVNEVVDSQTPVGLAADDRSNLLFAFNPASPFVSINSESLGSPSSGSLGFSAAAAVGAVDTDGDNLYQATSSGVFTASSYGGTALSGFGYGIGIPLALVVLSTDEQ